MITIVFEGMTEGTGGKESYIINVFRELDKKRYCCFFISYNEKIAYEQELIDRGATIVHVTPRNKNPLAFLKDLDAFFSHNKIDVVWAHKTTLSSCEVLQVAKKHHVPVRIIHSHSSENMGKRFTQFMHDLNKKRIDSMANVRLACSGAASKWFFDDRGSIIMTNAIKLQKYRYNPAIRQRIRTDMNLDSKLVIGHVGRFGAEKNHVKLLNVFYLLHKDNPDTILLLCGDGEEREHIEQQISTLHLEDSVRLLGRIDNVHEMLQVFDIMIMPSLFEGLPFALIEAQAAGLKCVVSDTISLESNVLGWNQFVELNAPDAEWVKTIQELNLSYDREQGYFGMKEHGFDLDESIAKIETILKKGLR